MYKMQISHATPDEISCDYSIIHFKNQQKLSQKNHPISYDFMIDSLTTKTASSLIIKLQNQINLT